MPIVAPDREHAARRAASLLADAMRAALSRQPRFALAVSGGHTAPPMLRALAAEPLAWSRVDVFQADERMAPEGSPDRNATELAGALAGTEARLHPIPCDASPEAAADRYERTLREVLGARPTIDLVHLGLGPEGHTASLFPGETAGYDDARDVVAVGSHGGWRRVTMTHACLSRARARLWLVTGAEKRAAVRALIGGDGVAGTLRRDGDHVVVDRAAYDEGGT
ncbi:MAG: 6-phosphogluconolactonase [Sandaracinaceae bacterium]